MSMPKVALRIAIYLMHVPSQVRHFRNEPLPDGVPLVLRIAADDAEAIREAVELTDRSPETVRDASEFYIEQILFAPNADSYRILGATAKASASELRHNLALLFRWLHPDRHPDDQRMVFVNKVTGAWNSIKTPERRVAYDALLTGAGQSRSRSRRPKGRSGRKPAASEQPRHGANAQWAEGAGFLRRAWSAIFPRLPR
jgi:hypothetical protein